MGVLPWRLFTHHPSLHSVTTFAFFFFFLNRNLLVVGIASQIFCSSPPQVPLLPECMHGKLHLCILGLEEMGARNRLDGYAWHQFTTGFQRSRNYLAKSLFEDGIHSGWTGCPFWWTSIFGMVRCGFSVVITALLHLHPYVFTPNCILGLEEMGIRNRLDGSAWNQCVICIQCSRIKVCGKKFHFTQDEFTFVGQYFCMVKRENFFSRS